ncbi:Rieske 2Fe-2S domain-containing protein [Nocardia sp. NBC_01327]|uniref:Rieske 2Fe-2S domain-containing protein n=1 Tax=Nocardia sp. NBC_01327 TaxID=2903593 RepID=UPI002E0DDA62|nr:Rieske 2Fe-2S domain-containing protein [Nocardia sp. NBC_01327]
MTTTFSNTDPGLRRFWHPVATQEAVAAANPLQVWLLGEPWVLARLDGELIALRDRCPHRLVPLSEGTVVGATLQCKYHGYRFDATGRCVHIPAVGPGGPIPARARTDAARVRLAFGLVWLTTDPDPIDSDFSESPYLDSDFDTFLAGPFTTAVGAGLITDNFMDVTHLPFLHAETFAGHESGISDLHASRDGWTIRQRTPGLLADESTGAPIDVTYDYIVRAPFSAELKITYDDGRSDYIWSFCQPETTGRTTWYMVQAYGGLHHDGEMIDRAARTQRAVGLEDLAILESMPDPQIPIDLTAEVHTKGDRGCVRYRRMLRDIADGALTSAHTTDIDRHQEHIRG